MPYRYTGASASPGSTISTSTSSAPSRSRCSSATPNITASSSPDTCLPPDEFRPARQCHRRRPDVVHRRLLCGDDAGRPRRRRHQGRGPRGRFLPRAARLLRVDPLGVGYEDLRAVNPRIIYSSVTAFGPDGPFRDRPGFDPLLQAMGGVMATQGFGGPPKYMRIAVTDYYTAALSCQAILAALFVRERTGRGQHVRTSLLQGVMALQSGSVVDYPGLERSYKETPTYRIYQAQDGKWLFLAV